MAAWDPGLPRWMDPMDIFGYSHKTMDDMGSGIVTPKPTTRSGGKTQSRMTDWVGVKSRKRNRSAYEQITFGTRDSLSAAQRAAQSFTEAERKKRNTDKMPRSRNIEAYGSKYKPNFKTVKVGPLTSRLKYVKHVTHTRNNAAYVSFSDIGPRDHYLRCLAEAFVMYYMKRVGENRVSLHRENVHTRTWGSMRLEWRLQTSGAEVYQADLIDGHTGTGTIQPFAALADAVRADFASRTELGYELHSVTIFEKEGGTGGDEAPVMFFDPDAGRHDFNFEAVAHFKVQNTTDADHVEGTLASNMAAVAKGDRNNIHANPVDGLVYRFRNAVPKWSAGFLAEHSDNGNDLNDLHVLNNVGITDVSGVTDLDLAAYLPNEFKVPPPAPYTMFANCSGRSKIYIKPGEFKTLKLKEFYHGTINSFIKRYVSVANAGGGAEIPPGGNCYMIGLKPTLRTQATESVELQCETQRYYAGVVKTRALTATPITNIVS